VKNVAAVLAAVVEEAGEIVPGVGALEAAEVVEAGAVDAPGRSQLRTNRVKENLPSNAVIE
jgi:hypothetical protein